jgi:hypothetical protein
MMALGKRNSNLWQPLMHKALSAVNSEKPHRIMGCGADGI